MRFRAISKSLVTFCLIVIYSNPCIAKSANEVVSIEVNSSESSTAVRIKFNQKISYSWNQIPSPNRLYFDFENTQLNKILEEAAEQIKPSHSPLLTAKAAKNTPNITRLVFTLEEGVTPKISGSKNNNEIIFVVTKAEGNLDPIENFYKAETDIDTGENKAEQRIAKKNKFVIAIDPGHGGKDPGALGARGTQEKHITLAIANRLAKLINKEPNMRAVLTRSTDVYIPLRDRIEKIRKHEPTVFISIHADAAENRKASGSSVFILSEKGESSVYARWVAKKENEADLLFGPNIDNPDPHVKTTLIDLNQTFTTILSERLAENVLARLKRVNNLHKENVEKAAFAVLKSLDVCSILVETAFLSNRQEEKDLNKGMYQEQVAVAILDGLKNFFEKTSAEELGVTIAEN